MNELRFMVPGVSCSHCVDAVSSEISKITGVARVDIDLQTKWAVVCGRYLDIAAIRVAVAETGHPAQL